MGQRRCIIAPHSNLCRCQWGVRLQNTIQSQTRDLHAFILAGGHGERLWPSSRPSHPKQFLKLGDSANSLYQSALVRAADIGATQIQVLCNEEHRFLAAQQALEIGANLAGIILEPCRRDTAASITLAASLLSQANNPSADFIVLASDHLMPSTAELADAVITSAEAVAAGKMVIFGISPNEAHTGYGYIKHAASGSLVTPVLEFVEKPSAERAEEMIASKSYAWNSGMLMTNVETFLAQAELHSPATLLACQSALAGRTTDGDFIRVNNAEYATAPSISVDYAILEKSASLMMASLQADWGDAGTWSGLYGSTSKDQDGNVDQGKVLLDNIKNSYIRSESRLVVASGLENMLIVETPDAVLVSKLSDSKQLKTLVEKTASRYPQCQQSSQVHRPWGRYERVTEGEGYQVKRLTINSGMKISLQTHQRRSEHWLVVSGTAEVTINQTILCLSPTASVDIPINAKHSVKNSGTQPLEIIEIQSGSYLGEDDIVRYPE